MPTPAFTLQFVVYLREMSNHGGAADAGLAALDESLKDAVAPALWLLDALPESSPFLGLDPGQRGRFRLQAF